MATWKITLAGYGDTYTGDVITDDGEVIGTWASDENDHCSFTPSGEQEPVLYNPFVGQLCKQIAYWHERHQ